MRVTKEPSLKESLAEWKRRIASYAASLQALRNLIQAHREQAKGEQREYLDHLLEAVEEIAHNLMYGASPPRREAPSEED